MIDKNSFKEVNEGTMLLPGNISVRDITLSDEEITSILEEMSHYLFRQKHHYSYTNREHSECDEESNDIIKHHLDELPEHYHPLYLIKDKCFYGLCVTTDGEDRATFLVNGESYGKTETHDRNSFGNVNESDDNYYSMIREQ